MKLVVAAAFFLGGCASTSANKPPEPLLHQTSSCNQPTMVSPTKLQYFKALVAKPYAELDEFLVTWSDRKEVPAGEPYFTKCEPQPFKSLLPIAKTLNLPAECSPDVLYAWGSYEKLSELTHRLKTGEKWKDNPLPHSENIWASLSPATGFTSGPYQIRIKLKKGVPIYSPLTERQLQAAADIHAVVYGGNIDQKLSLGDFIIYDAAAIAGWSYATPEQYDEIVREIKWIKSGERALGYLQNEPFARKGWPRFFALGVVKFGEPTEETLKQNLITMVKAILNADSEIGFNGAYCPTRAEFFKATKPTYVAP